MQQTILAIAGKPGLYKLVSRGSNNLIVEALDATHKRMPAFATDRITSLADIAMFTETDDVPLMDVLDNLKTLENGKKASINEKKATGDELRAYFTKVLPEWDQERVHNSDIKKRSQQRHQETHHLVQHPRRSRHHRLQGRDVPHRRRQHRRS